MALDWYNTVHQNGWVPPENLEGLKLLQDHGFTLLSFEWGSVIRRRQRWVASWNGYRPTRLASSSMMTGSSWKSAGTMGFGCMQCAQTPKRSSSPVYSEQAYSGPQPLIFIQKFVGLSMKRALPLLGPPRPLHCLPIRPTSLWHVRFLTFLTLAWSCAEEVRVPRSPRSLRYTSPCACLCCC